MCQVVIAGREKTLGANHVDTLWAKGLLADTLTAMGRVSLAKELYIAGTCRDQT